MSYSHINVINDNRHLIDWNSIRTLNDKIIEFIIIHRNMSVNQIIPFNDSRFEFDTDSVRFVLCHQFF